MSDFWRLSASEIATLVRSREVSARDVCTDALARLASINPRLNAIVECSPNDALLHADRIDGLIAKGADPGILAGVPITTKINVDHVGFATSNGTVLQRDLFPKQNSPVVDNLLRAGAVPLGRSNASAFALRWFTDNRLYGRTINPLNPALTAGGSSGGAAASVAVGVGAIAHGTDIAGSIRFPAYACGIHGLRPSLGRVPSFNGSLPERGIGPQLMAVSGPLARSIADVRLGLQAMSRGDPRDPWWVPAPMTGIVGPRRAAFCLRPGQLDTAPTVRNALHHAAKALANAGWQVEEIDDVASIRDAAEIQENLWLGEGFSSLRSAANQEGDRGSNIMIEAFRSKAESLAPDVILRSLTRRATLLREWNIFFERFHVVILPVSAELPFPIDLDLAGANHFWGVWEAQLVQRALAALGVPALTVSACVIQDSPVGVQIVAGRFQEEFCLEAGEVLESSAGPRLVLDPSPI